MRRAAILVAAALATLGAAAPPDAAPPPSVVIIVVDTLRADHLGCYGYFRPTSPHIDAFAADSALFARAMTPIGTTLPAHVSLFTSTNPSRHGVRGNYEFFHVPVPSDGKLRLAAQMFGRMGYRTAAFVSSPALSHQTGLAAGFDLYSDQPEGGPKHLAELTTNRVLEWLDKIDDRPFFLFVHYVDPHSPYEPPEPYRTMFETEPALHSFVGERDAGTFPSYEMINGYDGEIRYADEHVGRLLDKLREKGLYDRAAIVFTADHGEGLGQHGWLYHSRIYNEQILVPLLVRMPGRADLRGRRVEGLASLIDVLPILAGGLRLPFSEEERAQFEGMDVLGGARREYVFAERVPHHRPDPELEEYFGLAGTHWKLFFRPHEQNQLFDVLADPAELSNVIAANPGIAREMLDQVERQLARYGKSTAGLEQKPRAELGEDVKERLRQLGYDMN